MKPLFYGCLLFLTLACSQAGLAQVGPGATVPPLAYHALRTIDPADENLADLEFLRTEVGAARVVMLGEPTHGEGNVFEAKIRLVRFLLKMGFTTVAFESGFYELDRAEQGIRAGQNVNECLAKSLFPIWSESREFTPLGALIAKNKLRITGFDPQISGEYAEELVDDLQKFLAAPTQQPALPYDYLEEVIDVMAQQFTFPPNQDYAVFNAAIGKALKQLRWVAAHDTRRQVRAAFWVQCLSSLNALAADYAQHDPLAKEAADYKAVDGNPRDRQMADNLLWYLRQHPQEKVICWGATPHFGGTMAGLQNAELRAFRPMGSWVKAALPGQVYVLATTGGSGEYGNVYQARHPIPVPPAGSLEAQLNATGSEYLFLSMKQPALQRETTTSLVEYTPITGRWDAVVDGILFLKTIRPPEPLTPAGLAASATAPATGGTTANVNTPHLRPAPRSVILPAPVPAASALRGLVIDQATKRSIPFASVFYKQQGTGLTTNIKGEFELPRPARPDTLVVTCLGFGRQEVPIGPQATITVSLSPQAYSLADVTVRAERLDARQTMARIIKQLPQNYWQQGYNARVYARASSTNFDSLLYDVEYVSTYFDEAGYRAVGGATSRLEEVRWNQRMPPGPQQEEYHYGRSGYFTYFLDLLDQNPLFQARTLNKYAYSLGPVIEYRGQETLVLNFVAKKKSHRTTGDYYDQSFTGKLYINHADYAVTKCEVEWGRDTVLLNRFTRKYFAQGGSHALNWHSIHQDFRIRQTITYQPRAGGGYFMESSTSEWIEKHQNLFTQKPMEKRSVLALQFSDVRTTGVEPLPQRPDIRSMMLGPFPYHEAFWTTFRAPLPPEGQRPGDKASR